MTPQDLDLVRNLEDMFLPLEDNYDCSIRIVPFSGPYKEGPILTQFSKEINNIFIHNMAAGLGQIFSLQRKEEYRKDENDPIIFIYILFNSKNDMLPILESIMANEKRIYHLHGYDFLISKSNGSYSDTRYDYYYRIIVLNSKK